MPTGRWGCDGKSWDFLGGGPEQFASLAGYPSAVPFAHNALNNLAIDLSGPVKGQLVGEVDPAGVSIGGTVGEAELLQFLFGDLAAPRLHHQCHSDFALDRVRRRYDRRLGYGWMTQ